MLYHCTGTGNPLTLVMTDVEGSTELWEWDKHTTMRYALLDKQDELSTCSTTCTRL